jgi:hypothetical protein
MNNNHNKRVIKLETNMKSGLKEDEVILDGLFAGITGKQLSEILKNVAGATRGLPNLTQTKIED